MVTGELKSKVDRVWDAFWTSGISNPLKVMEHIREVQRITSSVPPLALQNTLVGRFAAVDMLRAREVADSVGLDALFASLQHRASAGEL